MKYLSILFVLLFAFSCQKKTASPTDTTTSKASTASINDFDIGEGVLLDVRTPGEYEKGRLPQSTNLDFLNEDYEAKIDALNKDKTYYIYCASGGRSGDMAEIMAEKGLKVVDLSEGFSKYTGLVELSESQHVE